MSVYVDDLFVCIRTPHWRHPSACHMLADTLPELHIMARRLSLKRSWFQNRTLPHYDLTLNKRQHAIRLGAIEITREQLVEMIRKERTK